MHGEHCAGGIIFNSKNQVALVCNKGLTWTFPKGHIEHGEDLLEAAYREIREEAGLEKSDLEYVSHIPSYSRQTFDPEKGYDHDHLKTMHLFVFKTDKEILKPIDPDNPDACWMNIEDAVYRLSNPGDIIAFKKFLAEPSTVSFLKSKTMLK